MHNAKMHMHIFQVHCARGLHCNVKVQAMCEIHSNMMGMRHMYMCTMLAHTCVVVVHVFMFIGSKSAPRPVEVLYSKWLAIVSCPRNLLNASQISNKLFSAESRLVHLHNP